MTDVVLYATGSAIIVDVMESLRRAGLHLVAGIRNHPGACYLGEAQRGVTPENMERKLIDLPFLVPLFTPSNRRAAVVQAREHGFMNAFTLVDPTAVTPLSMKIGEGTYIAAATSLGAISALGRFAFINRGASIGHHFVGGDFVSVGPGAVIAGQVTIGPGTLVGAGAVLLPCVTVGSGCTVGAGAVVTRDVPDGCLVVGNPARKVRTNLPNWQDYGS